MEIVEKKIAALANHWPGQKIGAYLNYVSYRWGRGKQTVHDETLVHAGPHGKRQSVCFQWSNRRRWTGTWESERARSLANN